eukprot:2563678-Amphidinium_carterae.1
MREAQSDDVLTACKIVGFVSTTASIKFSRQLQCSQELRRAMTTTQNLASLGLVIVPVPADGDCLFHALALHEDGNGAALRVEVADYLDQEAINQEESQSWLAEAANLRDDQWATHTAVSAYALMRKRQVVVHMLNEKTQAHNTISLLDQDVGMDGHGPIHIWYNGRNHYDGMVHSSSAHPMPASCASSYGDDFPPLSASPKKRQRRFIMEPSSVSQAPPSSLASEPHTRAPCRRRYTTKRPPMQSELSEDVARDVVCQKLEDAAMVYDRRKLNPQEPLVLLPHGPPGTGKSHALRILRDLFNNILGYTQGIEYEITAFQAVNAADIGGKTIHHAFGLNVSKYTGDEVVSRETAKRLAHLRWLIIDEISMVNARLFAQLEQRLRAVIPSANAWKHDENGDVRPFAGVNVLLLGDFHQLPPPDGGFLADIPNSLRGQAGKTPDPLADYGRELMWRVQGVTELTDRERCRDEWWNEVVDELRLG